MKIKDIIKDKQPEVYRKLMKERKDHLSFYDIQELMQGGIHVYKRGKGGALKQIK